MLLLLLVAIVSVGSPLSHFPPLHSQVIYQINHAVVDVPDTHDNTHQLYAIGVRSSFSHRRSKKVWRGNNKEPLIAHCASFASNTTTFPPPSPPHHSSPRYPPSLPHLLPHSMPPHFQQFNTSFISCHDVWDNSIEAQYNEPIQIMRSAGWPCKDEHVHDTDSLTRRHILEGFILLPSEEVAVAVRTSFLSCRLCSFAPDECLSLFVSNNIISQRIQLITSGASHDVILNASKHYVDTNMARPSLQAQAQKSAAAGSSKLHKILTFLETNEWMTTMGLIGMKQILIPAVDGVMKPVVNVVAQQVGPELSAPLTEDMSHGLNEELPGDVAAMLEQTLTANLTNLLTDSLTMRLADSLTTSLTDELGKYLDGTITDAAQPRLHTALHNILSETVPKRLNRDIPTLLIRSLKIGLVQTLTRSVTHSLVPSLALSLTHNKRQDYFCYVCFHYHLYCRLCHYSPQSAYYLQYYSGYYSDYFSTFYADYYTQALINIDTLEHPLSHWKGKSGPGGAEKGNSFALSTEKEKALKLVKDARDRQMSQHTSLMPEMLKVKNGETLGRLQSPLMKNDVNHKGNS